MLNCCISTSKELILNFNCCKSSCKAICQVSSYVISNMQLGFSNISWSSSFKYLGVTFIGGKNLSVDINIVKRKFYSACNCILRKTCSLNEIMRFNLQECFCLPVLQYAMAAVRLSKLQVSELNACWNSVFIYIFASAKSESVRAFIFGMGRIDFTHIRMLQSYNFYEKSVIE